MNEMLGIIHLIDIGLSDHKSTLNILDSTNKPVNSNKPKTLRVIELAKSKEEQEREDE